MKILLLEQLHFEEISEIKTKLENYYLSQNKNFESKKLEFSLLKTIGTKIDNVFYLWMNDSVMTIKNHYFKNIEQDKGINLIFSESIPNKSVFDKLYLKTFKPPKDDYDVFYLPLALTLKIQYYGKTFTSFYDFVSGDYSYDKLGFSMSDMENYYRNLHKGRVLSRKSDKYYLISETDKFTNYMEVDLKTGNIIKTDEKVKLKFVNEFVEKNYNVQYSPLILGKVSKLYLFDGRLLTVDFARDKVVKEEKVLDMDRLLKKIKEITSFNDIKHYTVFKDKVYANLENDEKELLIIMNINGKLMNTYQILKEKSLKKILDFSKFSQVKITRTQRPSLDEEYIPGYYDIIAYDHDFQLTYRVYDDGRYDLISKQILIATAIEKSEKYLKNERLVKFPIFKKDNSEFNAATNSWILTFEGRNVEYSLKVYTDDDKIKIEPFKIITSDERMEYLFKKILGFKVQSVTSKKHLFSGQQIWIIKYKDKDGNIKTMKLTSEDDLLKYYKKS